MSLKQKTITGLKWSFIDSTINQGIQFIVGIILARLLSPNEFGLIGMLTFFIAISQSFIDSGFGQALVRRKNCTDSDYSTVFYFNLIIGILFYLLLFFSANAIGKFYNEPILIELIRIIGLVLIVNSLTILQRTILTKQINFKLQAKISLIASCFSGLVGIGMAYQGYGVWALVGKTLSQQFINALLLWIWNRWLPKWTFNKVSFKEMYKFGSRLMLSGLIDTTYKNVYYLIIGKFFSADELGYYTRASQFSNLPSSSLTTIVQRVFYPVLSSVQDEPQRLKSGYKKLIKGTVFITFILMLFLAAVSKSLVIMLIGYKWLPSVVYLQLLCLVGILYPLHAINLNMLNVKGRSDLFLKIEIIKKILSVPIIIIGVFIGIKTMIIGMIVFSFVAYYINCYWSSKLIDYPIKEQINDILPSFLFALILSFLAYLPVLFLNLLPIYMLMLQTLTAISFFFVLIRIFKIDAYIEMKSIIMNKLKFKMKNNEN